MDKLTYDFLGDEFKLAPYTVFKSSETPIIHMDLGDYELPDNFLNVNHEGKLLAKNTFKKKPVDQVEVPSDFDIHNTEEVPIQESYSTNISFEDLLKEEGINAYVTSGYREGALTSSGKPSNHSKKGGAYDIVPTNGKTFDDLKKELYSNPRIVKWFKENNWGIYSELTKERMKKTNATGPHLHIGPDSGAVREFEEELKKYQTNG